MYQIVLLQSLGNTVPCQMETVVTPTSSIASVCPGKKGSQRGHRVTAAKLICDILAGYLRQLGGGERARFSAKKAPYQAREVQCRKMEGVRSLRN